MFLFSKPTKEELAERPLDKRGRKEGVALTKGAYWALGDNSANSSDSRNWGVVPEENIVGRAAFVYYPFGHHFGNVD